MLSKASFQSSLCCYERRAVKCFAQQQSPTECVGHGERVTPQSVVGAELTFEVDVVDLVRIGDRANLRLERVD